MDARSALATLGGRYGLDAIYAFGSRAEEAARFVNGGGALDPASRSDIDIGVLPVPDRRLSFNDTIELGIELEDLFRPARVDLVNLPQARPFLAADIVMGELLWVSDRDHEADYQLYVLRRAGDLAPFERERQDLIFHAGGR